MKKVTKIIVCFVWIFAVCFFIAAGVQAEEETVIQKGTCGSNANWYRTLDGKIYIYGNGSIENNWVITETIDSNIPADTELGKYPVKQVIIQEGISSIAEYALSCYGFSKEIFNDPDHWLSTTVEKVFIPSSVKKIGNSAFLYNKKLQEVTFASNSELTQIDDGAFMDCSELKKIILPKSLSVLGKYAFCQCSKLEEIDLPTVEEIDNAFLHCKSLKKIRISAKTIGGYSFAGCENLEEVEICANVKLIGSWAFSQCTKLKKVTLYNGLTEIGTMAFEFCEELEEISIPETVKELGGGIFIGCDKLKTVYFYGDCPWELPKFVSETTYKETNEETGEGHYDYAIFYLPDMFSSGIVGKVNETNKSIYFKDINLTLYPDANGRYSFDNWSFSIYKSKLAEDTVWNIIDLIEVVPSNVVITPDPVVLTGNSSVTAYYPIGKTRWSDQNRLRISKTANWKEWNPYGYKVLNTVYISNLINTKKGIKISWKAVNGASGYYIYRKNKKGGWKKIKYVQGTSYIDNSVKKKTGEVFSYYVRPYAGHALDLSKPDIKAIARFLPLKINEIKRSGKKIYISWKPEKLAAGYCVQYSLDAKFTKKKNVKIKKNKQKASITLKNKFGKKKKCFVRICAYKKWKGKIYYGGWSKVKKVIKK